MDNRLRKLGAFTLSAIMLLGCAGREAHPVSTYQYGDEKKSCKALEMELTFSAAGQGRVFQRVRFPLRQGGPATG